MAVLKARIGGAWVPVGGGPSGGGTDEVVVSATEPPLAETELWYDTSAPASPFGLIANPNNALGIVAVGGFKSGLANPVDLSGSLQQLTEPIAITTLVGRRYRIVFQIRALALVTGTGFAAANFILYDGGVVQSESADWYVSTSAVAPAYSGTEWGAVIEGDGAAHTYAIWGRAWTYNVRAYWNGNCRYYIEDVGPIGSPALPIPTIPQAWTAFPHASGWSNIGSGHQPARYRKIGDIVYMEGLIQGPVLSGIAESTTGTLPVGFRPPNIVTIETVFGGSDASGGPGRLQILPDGRVNAVQSALHPNPGAMCSLCVSFSVTA